MLRKNSRKQSHSHSLKKKKKEKENRHKPNQEGKKASTMKTIKH
jgi:hypothetical protein